MANWHYNGPMRYLFLVLLLALLGIPHNTDANKPNVIFISIDDLNDWIGVLGGHPQVKTPELDKFANKNVLFKNAHCQAPICNPSRASFMSGLLPSTTGVYLLRPADFRVTKLLKKNPLIPEYFSKHGYKTMAAGKIYHSGANQETFDEYVNPRPTRRPRNRLNKLKPKGKQFDWGIHPERDEDTQDTKVANWAIEELGKIQTKPFFLAVGFKKPHTPWYVPQKWWDIYPEAKDIILPKVLKGDRDDLSEYAKNLTFGSVAPRHELFVTKNLWHDAVRAYLSTVSYLDHQVGRVLEALEKSPYAKNTVVIIFSDHGFELGEKERWAKRSLWERSTRVPLMIKAPGIKKGVTTKPVGLIDMYPTLLALCGLPPIENLDGRSLVPLLEDNNTEWNHPAITTFWKNNHAVRSEHWRYISYADGSEELYDHCKDPHEWYNLAGLKKYKSIIEEHKQFLPRINVKPIPYSEGSDSVKLGIP